MITKIISGGQTGADKGGLQAAKVCKIPTGGWCPKGCLTENGSDIKLVSVFGLKETGSDKYPPRTFMNAKEGDGTIRFAADYHSRGELLTLKAIRQFGKPYFDVDVTNPLPVEDVVRWLKYHKIKVLNVAGNAESRHNGIQSFTMKYLIKVIKMLNGN